MVGERSLGLGCGYYVFRILLYDFIYLWWVWMFLDKGCLWFFGILVKGCIRISLVVRIKGSLLWVWEKLCCL